MESLYSTKDKRILDLAVQAGLVYWEGEGVYSSIREDFDVGDELLKFAHLIINHGQFIKEPTE